MRTNSIHKFLIINSRLRYGIEPYKSVAEKGDLNYLIFLCSFRIICYICSQNLIKMIMTAIQMNAELLRNMSIIAEDEVLLKRAAKYLRKLVAEKQSDSSRLSKDEFFARVDEAKEEIRQGKCIRFSDPKEMNDWLNSL